MTEIRTGEMAWRAFSRALHRVQPKADLQLTTLYVQVNY
jgi:hypothetical protein